MVLVDLAEADVAFIVDACVASRRVRLRRLIRRANKPALLDGHAFAPAELIGLADMVYGRCAPTYLLHVPAEDFAYGDTLSARATAGVRRAVQLLDGRLAVLV